MGSSSGPDAKELTRALETKLKNQSEPSSLKLTTPVNAKKQMKSPLALLARDKSPTVHRN